MEENKFQGSIENASIMRKFTILFLLMSLIPTCVLYFFYLEIEQYGRLKISPSNFNLTLTIIVIGVFIGYLAMRAVLKKIISLVSSNIQTLEHVLEPEALKEIDNSTNEITVLAKSFAAVTTRLEDNIRDLELAKKTLHSVLFKVGNGISSMQNIDAFLELIVETVTEALTAQAGALMLISDDKKFLTIKTVYGVDIKSVEKKTFLISESPDFTNIVHSKKPISFSNKNNDFSSLFKNETLFSPPIACVPLIMKDKLIGVLSVGSKKDNLPFNPDEMNLLSNLAAQTAVAIKNSQLSRDIEKTYFETISALALAVDAKDKYSRGHLDRVANYSVLIANRLGLDDEDRKTLRAAARLHDLGKLGIPDNVLCKAGPLNDAELALMYKHPEIGESIIKPVRSLRYLCDIIRHHHEKLDGTGYPDGIKGEEITPLVRITAVADVYDALTTNRSYRKKLPNSEAFKILLGMKNAIDQDIVKIFIEAIEELSINKENN